MSDRVKVAFVITRLCEGGAVRAVCELARHLDRNRLELTLIYGSVDAGETDVSDRCQQYFEKTFHVPRLQRSFHPWRDHFATQDLQKIFRQQSFDIVHTHTSKAGFLGRLAARREKVPYVVHSTHGSIFTKGAGIPGVGPLKRCLFLHAEKIAAQWCRRILTLSQAEIEGWKQLQVGSPAQYRVLPSPTDVDTFYRARNDRSALRQEAELSDDDWLMVVAGRLAEEKGIPQLLQAMAEGAPGDLWLVGDGPHKGLLKQQVKTLGIDSRVRFVGFDDTFHQWLSMADVLCLPSTYEGQGLVLIEAMAAAVPVVATRVGGVPEVVEHEKNGLLIDVGDASGLKNALVRLQADHELRDRLIRGGDKTYPQYRPEEAAQRLMDIYADDMALPDTTPKA